MARFSLILERALTFLHAPRSAGLRHSLLRRMSCARRDLNVGNAFGKGGSFLITANGENSQRELFFLRAKMFCVRASLALLSVPCKV